MIKDLPKPNRPKSPARAIALFVAALLILAGLTYGLWGGGSKPKPSRELAKAPFSSVEALKLRIEDEEIKQLKREAPASGVDVSGWQFFATLTDVSGGESVGGIETNGSARGETSADWDGKQYQISSKLENLPELGDDQKLVGWVVDVLRAQYILLGQYEPSDGEPNEQSLYFRAGNNLNAYAHVVVTVQSDPKSKPGPILLTGDLLR